ncbi:hypothetical protein [Azotobacter vinelandii]
MSKTLYGTTPITLGGSTYELVPSLGAVRAIEARFGGLRGAIQACEGLSVEGVAHIVAAGAGLTGKAAAGLPDEVWQAGVAEVSVQLRPYLLALLNPRGAQADEGNDKTATATAP